MKYKELFGIMMRSMSSSHYPLFDSTADVLMSGLVDSTAGVFLENSNTWHKLIRSGMSSTDIGAISPMLMTLYKFDLLPVKP